jgi:hypothetical protein
MFSLLDGRYVGSQCNQIGVPLEFGERYENPIIWLGNCSLAILCWDLFILVYEQEATVAQAWDGVNLRFTFRRCVS